jgi:hypothetical protein
MALPSFRGDAKHRTRNLEIPGLVLTHHPGMTALMLVVRSHQTLVAGTRGGIYSPHREHHMINILAFFSTRTLLQIIFILASTVAMKAWSLGLLFGG